MEQLEDILGKKTGWTIIGSSLGGSMATLFAVRHPAQVRKLVLLAPALVLLDHTEQITQSITIPCTIIHGTKDDIVSLEETRTLAEKIFTHLEYIVAEDDHRLHKAAEELDWRKIVEQ